MKTTNNNPMRDAARAALLLCSALSALAALAALSVSATAAADDPAYKPTYTIGVRNSGVLIRNRGLDPVSASDIIQQSGLYADVEFLSTQGNDHLSLGLEWVTSGTSAETFQRFQADHRAHYGLLALTYRIDITSWLSPYIRTSVGFGVHALDIEGYEVNNDWVLASSHGLGVEVFIPYDAWSPDGTTTLGARLELGALYQLDPEFTLTKSANTPADTEEIPISGADLGSMPTSGFSFTFDAFIRF